MLIQHALWQKACHIDGNSITILLEIGTKRNFGVLKQASALRKQACALHKNYFQ